jgi:hypothetical protein
MAEVKQFAAQILSLFLLSVFVWNAYALPTNAPESKGRPATAAGQLIHLALEKAEQLQLKTVPVAGADVNQTQKQERDGVQQGDGPRHDRSWAQSRLYEKKPDSSAVRIA